MTKRMVAPHSDVAGLASSSEAGPTLVYEPLCPVSYCPAKSSDDWHHCFVCKSPHIDHHHVETRGMGGSKKPQQVVVPLCRKHHELITIHKWGNAVIPAWTNRHGLEGKHWHYVVFDTMGKEVVCVDVCQWVIGEGDRRAKDGSEASGPAAGQSPRLCGTVGALDHPAGQPPVSLPAHPLVVGEAGANQSPSAHAPAAGVDQELADYLQAHKDDPDEWEDHGEKPDAESLAHYRRLLQEAQEESWDESAARNGLGVEGSAKTAASVVAKGLTKAGTAGNTGSEDPQETHHGGADGRPERDKVVLPVCRSQVIRDGHFVDAPLDNMADEELAALYADADQRQRDGFLDKCHVAYVYRERHVQAWGESWTEQASKLFDGSPSRRTLGAYANLWQICVQSDANLTDCIGPLTDSKSLMQFIGRKNVEAGRVALEAAVAHVAEFGEAPTVAGLVHRLKEEEEPEGCQHDWARRCRKCGEER